LFEQKKAQLQNSNEASLAPKIKTEMGYLDWVNQTSQQIRSLYNAIGHEVLFLL